MQPPRSVPATPGNEHEVLFVVAVVEIVLFVIFSIFLVFHVFNDGDFLVAYMMTLSKLFGA